MAPKATAPMIAPVCVGKTKVRKPKQIKHASPTATPCVGKPRVRKPRQSKQRDEEIGEPVKQRKRKTNELFTGIGNVIGLNANDVEAVFDVLPHVIAVQLRENREFTIPEVMRLKLKAMKEQPEKLKKIKDKEVTVPAKPASLRVHALILKPLKVAVNAVGR
jgi:hypothetical protein